MNLLFKEYYWAISTFSNLTESSCTDKIMKIAEFIQTSFANSTLSDLNAKFIPDEEQRKRIISIAKSLSVTAEWHRVLEDFKFEEEIKVAENKHELKVYSSGGFILLRLKFSDDEGKKNGIQRKQIRSSELQQIVFLVWTKLIKEFSKDFKFDEATPPYPFTVCSGYVDNTKEIKWNANSLKEHAEELGQWAEIYSGQFSDYKHELYMHRLELDLSNRESEVHVINRNSCLLYMNPENYKNYFINDTETPNSTNYMYSQVILTVSRIRVILFAMLTISSLIDKDTKNLSKIEYSQQHPDIIKLDLEKVKRMKNSLQGVLAPIFTDLTRSHRQHYAAVLKRSMEINEIEINWERILRKIESNAATLNSVYLDTQKESSERQEKILNMVNFILGGSIIFEIIGFIFREDTLVNNINSVVGIILIGILIFMLFAIMRKKKGDVKLK